MAKRSGGGPLSPEVDLILAKSRSRSVTGQPDLTPDEAIRLQTLALREYLGSGSETPAEPAAAAVSSGAEVGPKPPPSIALEVVWSDVTEVDADVHTVGHYQGVLPQNAELALDCAVSGLTWGEAQVPENARRLVITQHTRRGLVRGELGDISFFPWKDKGNGSRVVAVAGMGRPGTFDMLSACRLVYELVIAVSALPNVRTVCTVLMGSGDGTLTIPQAVRGLVQGICDATNEIAAASDLVIGAPIRKIVIAERDRGRADEILEALKKEFRTGPGALERPIEFDLNGRLRRGAGGTVSVEEALALLSDSLLQAAIAKESSGGAQSLKTLMEQTAANQTVRKLAVERLREEARAAASSHAPRFRVERRTTRASWADIPARVSFWDDGHAIRTAAIDHSTTVPERLIGVARDLIDDLTEKMTDPAPESVVDLCDLLYRLLVPPEFRDLLESDSVVFEIDRPMARLHWEMLASATQDGTAKPLSVRTRLARQLRTTYSPSPSRAHRPGTQFRALVIGDPGDPVKGEALPGAQSEALKVKELLEARDNVVVESRIGAPNVSREGRLQGVKPADRLEVLSLLLRGGFDLIHYAGHGDFDPEQPNRVGWVFAKGLLTPGEIGRLEHVPAIVVSNACLSARTSQVLQGTRRVDEMRSEAGLLPSLADEFFRLGVRNYLGTAWEVNDVGAELFAQTLYTALLAGSSFGEAVRQAREALWRERDKFGALWAAYQHYGDPTSQAVLMSDHRHGV